MILDKLDQAWHYRALNPLLTKAFEFLGSRDLLALSPGRFEILDQRLYAVVAHEVGRGAAGAQLEVHRKYLDVQVSLDGREKIGWRALADCHQTSHAYDTERDIALFADRPAAWIPLDLGHFLIFFPDDAHAPLGAEGPLHKVVVKVAMD